MLHQFLVEKVRVKTFINLIFDGTSLATCTLHGIRTHRVSRVRTTARSVNRSNTRACINGETQPAKRSKDHQTHIQTLITSHDELPDCAVNLARRTPANRFRLPPRPKEERISDRAYVSCCSFEYRGAYHPSTATSSRLSLSLSSSLSISQSPPDQLFLGDPTFLSLFVRCLNSAVIVFHYYNGVRLVEAVIVRAMVIFGREKFGRLCWRLIILVRFSRVVVAPRD